MILTATHFAAGLRVVTDPHRPPGPLSQQKPSKRRMMGIWPLLCNAAVCLQAPSMPPGMRSRRTRSSWWATGSVTTAMAWAVSSPSAERLPWTRTSEQAPDACPRLPRSCTSSKRVSGLSGSAGSRPTARSSKDAVTTSGFGCGARHRASRPMITLPPDFGWRIRGDGCATAQQKPCQVGRIMSDTVLSPGRHTPRGTYGPFNGEHCHAGMVRAADRICHACCGKRLMTAGRHREVRGSGHLSPGEAGGLL